MISSDNKDKSIKIIGITGKIGSGKSTCSEVLKTHFGFHEYSFAGPIKEIGRVFGFSDQSLYGTQEDKNQIHPYWGVSSRVFLQKLGTEVFRYNLAQALPEMKGSDSIWVELFKKHVSENPGFYVISDVRFLDEAKVIREMGGVIVKTVREHKDDAGVNVSTHSSEMELEKIKHDFLVDGNNIRKENLVDFFSEILKGEE